MYPSYVRGAIDSSLLQVQYRGTSSHFSTHLRRSQYSVRVFSGSTPRKVRRVQRRKASGNVLGFYQVGVILLRRVRGRRTMLVQYP